MANTLTQAGLDLIKSFESCSLTPYRDSRGIFTNGWGNTHGVTADTPPITQEDADNLLFDDLAGAESDVQILVAIPLNDNQYSALVSLVYNCGSAPLKAGLGKALNNGKYEEAAGHFPLWDKEKIDGVLVPSAGLMRRRVAEKALFETPIS